MNMETSALWFSVLYGIAALYALLDGFDLGVGIIQPFVQAKHRNHLMRAIAPFWDGNEVWLIVLEQTLMGVFPAAYGAILSGMYIPFLILTAALVLRVCAMEFRNKFQNRHFTRIWDLSFFASSIGATICFGLILGYLAEGLPLTQSQNLDEQAMHWQSPFPWVFASGVVAFFTLHGCVFLTLKTRGELQVRAKLLSWICLGLSLATLIAIFKVAGQSAPQLLADNQYHKLVGFAAVGSVLFAGIARFVWSERFLLAFICSGGLIVWGIATYASANFPDLVRASNNPNLTLTAENCITSPEGLYYLKYSLLVGIPLVLTYTSWVYWIFRGPVDSDEVGYS